MKKIILGLVILTTVVISGVFLYRRTQRASAQNQNTSSETAVTLSSQKNNRKPRSSTDLDSTKKDHLNIEYDQIQGVDKNLLSLDIYNTSEESQPKPVIIMVHGGGWSVGDKANDTIVNPKKDYFGELGYIFVSINYRLAPDYFFPDYPSDVANAVNWVYQNISKYNGNPNEVFLMGHSAGAHLAALVSVDSAYGLDSSKLKGLILLDGAGYDIPLALETSNKNIRTDTFIQAFGSDSETHKKASPIYQIQNNTKIPNTLILFVERREDSKLQSSNLHQKISDSGNLSQINGISNTSHEGINTNLGNPDFEATKILTEFLEKN